MFGLCVFDRHQLLLHIIHIMFLIRFPRLLLFHLYILPLFLFAQTLHAFFADACVLLLLLLTWIFFIY
jgi:hypothetical protein